MKNENEYFCIRQIDTQGRLVLPKEIRDRLGIVDGTPLRLSLSGSDIILRVSCNACFICGETENLIDLKGKYVCSNCLEKLNMKKQIEEE